MEAFEEDQNTHDPSSSQHKKELLLSQLVQDVDWDRIGGPECPLRHCLCTLLIYPEDAIINKRHTIYWWIGEGVYQRTIEKTAEEVAEDMIDKLLKLNIIVPYGNGKCPIVNKFKLNPHARRQLMQHQYLPRTDLHHLGYYVNRWYWLVLTQQKVTLGDGLILDRFTRIARTVLNVGVRYLNFGYQWLDKSINLKALQLGRWQDSPSHHIQVGSQEFMKDLGNQKELRYLGLRGISSISKLPLSIAQLESLQILDLKACHNLETLPDNISSLKSLTLHISFYQCYLLDGMPKGIEKLTKLQVLKGFLIGSPSKTPCRISDLANLENLRRLSIRIGSGAVIEDGEFESLEKLAALKHLKLSWGVSRYSDIPIILPSSLIKLHLECFPGQRIPDWVRNRVPSPWFPYSEAYEGIKELHITGGKLESMNFNPDSNLRLVKFVCLKYLKHLQVGIKILKELFPGLSYVEIKKIRDVSYFEWRSE